MRWTRDWQNYGKNELPWFWQAKITSFMDVEFRREAHDARKSDLRFSKRAEPGFFLSRGPYNQFRRKENLGLFERFSFYLRNQNFNTFSPGLAYWLADGCKRGEKVL
jgi:hypothetical protein